MQAHHTPRQGALHLAPVHGDMGHHLPLLPDIPHRQAEEFRDPEAGAMGHDKEGLIAQGAKACKRLGYMDKFRLTEGSTPLHGMALQISFIAW